MLLALLACSATAVPAYSADNTGALDTGVLDSGAPSPAMRAVFRQMEAAPTNSEAGDMFISAGPALGRAALYEYPSLVAWETAGSRTWTDFDFRNYIGQLWHPGEPRGTTCSQLTRLGGMGDGGKYVCEAVTTLTQPGPCLVLSVGSNGDVAFESSVHRISPACDIHIMDPTLDDERASQIPSYAAFYNTSFGEGTATLDRYRGKHVAILKIDCEGCEFEALPSWVAQTCTSQILLEVHGMSDGMAGVEAGMRLQRFHRLMSALETNYSVFSSEPNLLYSPHVNVEYGLRRRVPCVPQREERPTGSGSEAVEG